MKRQTDKQADENQEIRIAVLINDVGYMKAGIDSINKKMDDISSQFISRNEFEPVKRLVYGVVALILTAVVISILALVLQRSHI